MATAEIDTRSEPNKKRKRQRKKILSHQSKKALPNKNTGKNQKRGKAIKNQLSIRRINIVNTTSRQNFWLKTENTRLLKTAKNIKSELEF